MVVKKANTHSKQKLIEQIQQELSNYLRKELLSPKTQFVSIVKLELNKDNSVANVYWDSFDSATRGDAKAALEQMAPKMRKLLAQNLQLRHTPEIRLFYFSQFEDEFKIQQLINADKTNKE